MRISPQLYFELNKIDRRYYKKNKKRNLKKKKEQRNF